MVATHIPWWRLTCRRVHYCSSRTFQGRVAFCSDLDIGKDFTKAPGEAAGREVASEIMGIDAENDEGNEDNEDCFAALCEGIDEVEGNVDDLFGGSPSAVTTARGIDDIDGDVDDLFKLSPSTVTTARGNKEENAENETGAIQEDQDQQIQSDKNLIQLPPTMTPPPSFKEQPSTKEKIVLKPDNEVDNIIRQAALRLDKEANDYEDSSTEEEAKRGESERSRVISSEQEGIHIESTIDKSQTAPEGPSQKDIAISPVELTSEELTDGIGISKKENGINAGDMQESISSDYKSRPSLELLADPISQSPFRLKQPSIELESLMRPSTATFAKARRMEKLNRKLELLSQEREYQDAAKVLAKMHSLDGELTAAHEKEAVEKHNKILKALSRQERDCLNALQRKWDAKITAFNEETQRQIKNLKKEQITAQRHLQVNLFEAFRNKPLQFSATIMDMKMRELSLVKAQEYTQAVYLQEKIEQRAAQERERALQTCLQNIETAVTNLQVTQNRTLNILRDKRELQRQRLMSSWRSEEQKVWTCFQTAHRSAGLAHSLAKQTLARAKQNRLKTTASAGALSGMYTSTASERKYEATLSSVTSLTASLHADDVAELQDFDGGDESMMPLAAENGIGKQARQTVHSNATEQNHRKQHKKGTGKKRQFVDRKSQFKCDNCQRRLLKKSNAWVSIPKDYGRFHQDGIGQFCNWDCAKKWNQDNSPPQLRWTRELFMRTAGKQRPTSATSC